MSALPLPPLDADEQRARETAIEEALASVRMEGLEPPPSFHRAAAQFVAGELTLDEFTRFFDRTQRRR
jgi:hypothetical protein